MTTLTITITTANQEQMDANVNAFAMATGYKPTVQDENGDTVANPISAEQHSRAQVTQYISSNVSRYVTESKIAEARVTAAEMLESAIEGVTIE